MLGLSSADALGSRACTAIGCRSATVTTTPARATCKSAVAIHLLVPCNTKSGYSNGLRQDHTRRVRPPVAYPGSEGISAVTTSSRKRRLCVPSSVWRNIWELFGVLLTSRVESQSGRGSCTPAHAPVHPQWRTEHGHGQADSSLYSTSRHASHDPRIHPVLGLRSTGFTRASTLSSLSAHRAARRARSSPASSARLPSRVLRPTASCRPCPGPAAPPRTHP